MFDAPTRRALAPFAVPLALAPLIMSAMRTNLREPLFSDSLVFQYTAWCIRHGLRLYRDVGAQDGPTIHYLHAAIQAIVGITDRGFRRADLAIQIVGSGTMGALLAPALDPRRRVRSLTRAAWATATAAIWLSWYFTFGWEGTTQREGFYSMFGSVGMVLLFVSGDLEARWSRVALFAGAFFVTSQIFGKPTGIMYFGPGALIIAMPNATAVFDFWKRCKIFVAGSATFVLLLTLALLVSGSFTGYLHWCWVIPYVGNRYLYGTDWHRLYLAYWDRFNHLAEAAFVAGGASIGVGLLPPRALPFVIVPPVAYLAACLQARGFDYQIIPTIASSHLVFLLIVTRLWRTEGVRHRADDRGATAALALTFAGYYGFSSLEDAKPRWGGDPKSWDVPEHESGPDEKKAGLYVKDHTRPDDFVFVYASGSSHIVLFTAERKTAAPYFHVYWLDPVGMLGQSEVKPDAAQLAALIRMQDYHRKATCAAVLENKPAAMVFDVADRAYAFCPELRGVLANDFAPPAAIGALQVYLRKPR